MMLRYRTLSKHRIQVSHLLKNINCDSEVNVFAVRTARRTVESKFCNFNENI